MRILVVDDNKDFCDSLKDLLATEGHEVTAAYGGQDLFDLVQYRQFDVILIDLIMPDLDTIGTIKAIRKTSPSATVVAISGTDDNEVAKEALHAGAACVFRKPLDFAKLFAYIQS